MKYADHELAAIFPLMTDAELASLAEDIDANGLRDAIWLFEGKILDGRNRYRACALKDVDPRFEQYKGKDPLGFVVSKNLHRRHLTTSQRAMIAASVASMKTAGRPAKIITGIPVITQTQAADLFNVSTDSVQDAKKVQEQGAPELIEAVKSGDATVSAAADVADLPKSEQKKAVKSGTVAAKAKEQRAKKAAKKPSSDTPVLPSGVLCPHHAKNGPPAAGKPCPACKIAQQRANADHALNNKPAEQPKLSLDPHADEIADAKRRVAACERAAIQIGHDLDAILRSPVGHRVMVLASDLRIEIVKSQVPIQRIGEAPELRDEFSVPSVSDLAHFFTMLAEEAAR